MTNNDNQLKFADTAELKSWFEQHVKDGETRLLLAHHDDGVVWGRVENGTLTIAADVFSDTPEVQTQLNPATLRQARLFNETSELLLWHLDNASFKHRMLDESGLAKDDFFAETYLLWGEGEKADKQGFTLMVEGKQGLRHAPPLRDAVNERDKLTVIHHLEYDNNGQAHIARSRLAGLEIVQEEKNGN